MSELVVNLWAVYDASVRAVYCLSGRVYAMHGSDAEKLAVLKTLSRTDYLSAKRYSVPSRFVIITPEGDEREGVTYLNAVNDPNAMLFEEVFKNIEAELPALADFTKLEFEWVKQVLPDDPLCVITVLYEDDTGAIRAIVDDEDRRWVAEQEALSA
jgi:hypothetical protein